MKQEEEEMLKTQSIPFRNYLMKHVMPTLTQGLIECCKVRPDHPVEFLVSWYSFYCIWCLFFVLIFQAYLLRKVFSVLMNCCQLGPCISCKTPKKEPIELAATFQFQAQSLLNTQPRIHWRVTDIPIFD